MAVSESKLKRELEPFDDLRLECDGLTRVLHRVLEDNNIKHKVMQGYVEHQNEEGLGIPLHLWIELPNG